MGTTHQASLYEHVEIVQLLIAHRADVNQQDKDGWADLMTASLIGKFDVVQLLIANNANINQHSNIGWIVLMEACMNGRVDVVQLHADLHLTNREGMTEFMMAQKKIKN